jgi:hypothetical protein
MLKVLAVLASTVAVSPELVTRPLPFKPSPQCEYYRYMAAAVWSALDDAERGGASFIARSNIEMTLRTVVAGQRGACTRG